MAESFARVLPDRAIRALFDDGAATASEPLDVDQIQPASLDLRLGSKVWRLRASFLPGEARVEDRLEAGGLVMHELDLTQGGAVLETGCVYLAPLMERLALPDDVSGAANPKSSTGRIDVFVRVITDRAKSFDSAAPGYHGPLFAEICPRTFSILARPGERLCQMRFRQGGERRILREEVFCLDLSDVGDICGYRARRHSGVLDLRGVGRHNPRHFWEPLTAEDGQLILDPGEFYILASRQAVTIPPDEAAEMAPIAPELGEFRAHYAGFFDPGFGPDLQARAVLEVRAREAPFIVEHGQPVGKLVFEPLQGRPDVLYGEAGSHYQGQGLKLSKHFAPWT